MTLETALILIFGGTLSSTIATYLFTRNKTKADTSATQVKTAMDLMENIKKEYEIMRSEKLNTECEVIKLKSDFKKLNDEFAASMAELRRERDDLKEKNEELEERVLKLEAQLESLGEQPVTKRKRKTDK